MKIRNYAMLAILLLTGSLMPCRTASAVQYVVTNENDSGPGSLRQTIASAGSGADEIIQFAPGLTDIVLESPITVTKLVSLRGPINIRTGSGVSNLFNVTGNAFQFIGMSFYGPLTGDTQLGTGGLIKVSSSSSVLIENCVVQDSLDGGIANSGALTVKSCNFINNKAELGGGIVNDGTLGVLDSLFLRNSGGTSGGGIFNRKSMSVQRSTFSENQNGIDSFELIAGGMNAKTTIVDCEFTTNRFSGYLHGRGTATVTGSHFVGNGDTGIDIVGGTVGLERSTFGGQSSAFGIKNTGELTASQSTFLVEGGVSSDGHSKLTNCTFQNSGIAGQGGITVEFSTFKLDNGGKAVYGGYASNPVTINNSIIDDSPGGAVTSVASGDYNLIRNPAGYNFAAGGAHNLTGVDPLLGLLQKNHGPTANFALPAGSPAIDAADPASTLNVDQRGFTRPRDGDGNNSALPDIGSYEKQRLLIQGRIVATNGDALTNVTVTRSGSDGTFTTTTNSSGYYLFAGLAEATYTVTPSLTNYVFTPENRTLAVVTEHTDQHFVGRDITVSLYSISGRVSNGVYPAPVGGAYGDEVPNVPVKLTGGAFTGANAKIVNTLSNGGYTFEGLPLGTYTIESGDPNLIFKPATRTVTITGNNVSGQNFIGGLGIRGRIVSSSQGPHGGIRVEASNGAFGISTSAGYYHIAGLPKGTFTVTPVAAGMTFEPASRSVTLTDADVNGQDFRSGYDIRGVVSFRQGDPVGTISMRLNNGRTLFLRHDTSTTSRYAFTGVQNGTYTVTPSGPSGTSVRFIPANRTVTVNNGDVADQNFFAYTKGFLVHGRLSNSSGAALGGQTVTLSGGVLAGEYSRSVQTNSAGYYTFADVPPGTYSVTPAATGYSFAPVSRSVTVTDANVVNQNFVGSSGYLLHGRISDSQGRALANVRVTRNGSNAAAFTNSAGYYNFVDVPNGSYTVTPVLSGYYFTPTSREVTVSGANVVNQNFVARATLLIHGRVSSSNGLSLVGVEVSLTGAANATAITNSAGYYYFRDLQQGTYTVAPVSGAYTPASRTVTLTTGNAVNQNFVRSPG